MSVSKNGGYVFSSNWVTGRKHIENVYAMQECIFVIFLNFIAVTRE